MRFPWAVACVGLALATLSGCSGRLSEIGREPDFTPVGYNRAALNGVDPQHTSVAVAPPEDIRPGNTEGSLWHSGPSSLFGDRRARRLGDILTVVVDLSDEASISNESDRGRSGSDDLSIPNFLGIPSLIERVLPGDATLNPAVGVSSVSSAQGAGSISRSEEVTLRVAATVVDILPNGHMVIRGNQEIRVNFELRDLQVAGIVRPEDISRLNEIPIDKIAGARVAYGGRGQIMDQQQPRYGQQIADYILPY